MEKDQEAELEHIMKKLREMIVEVQKNQEELGKVLEEKGLSSTSFTKLTGSTIFEEEQEALNRAVERDSLNSRCTSIESLQLKFEKLKQKCNIKNRVIVALLKGLQNNAPKDWWEDSIECIFEELKPEEIDYKAMNEYIYRESRFNKSGKKALNLSSLSAPTEELLHKDIAQRRSNSELMTSIRNSEGGIKNNPKTITDLWSKKYSTVNLIKKCHSDEAHQASFFQSILLEDSQVGVAVVDLFVAVKKAKDKLEILSKMNDEASNKANILRNESISLKNKYDKLIGTINEFFDGINVLYVPDNLKKSYSQSVETEKSEISNNSKSEHEELLRNKVKHYKTCQAAQATHKSLYNLKPMSYNQLLDCFSLDQQLKNANILKDNINKEKEQYKMISSLDKDAEDALLAPPLKNKKDDNYDYVNQENLKYMPAVSKTKSQELEEFNQKAFSVSSGVRKTLSLPELDDDLENKDERIERELLKISYHSLCKNLSSPNLSNSFKSVSSSKSIYRENLLENCIAGDEKSNTSSTLSKKEDAISEGDSVFEEALSEWVNDIKTKSNTTLENSTTANETKKSTSPLMTDNDLLSSWISKLADDLKARIRKLKLDSDNQIFVDEKSTDAIENLEFKVKASTPFGLFDIVIKEYKNNMSEKKHDESISASNPVLTSVPDNEKIVNSKEIPVKSKEKGCYWSEDSLRNSDSDYLSQVGVTSAEDEMEEFIEVTLQRKKVNKLKGTLNRTTLKTEKVPFFEIQKCVPKYFFHEILVKGQAPPNSKVNSEVAIANEEVPEGQSQNNKKLIDVAYSDDFVIYIQVDSDEKGEENSNPNEIYIECDSNYQETPRSSTDQVQEKVSGHEIMKETEKEDENIQTQEKEILAIDMDSETEALKKKNPPLEFKEIFFEKRKYWGKLNVSSFWYSKLKAHIYIEPIKMYHISRIELRKKLDSTLEENATEHVHELKRAIELVHQIESNVVDVKLNDAILILPKLESELRKHMQNKIKSITVNELSTDSSVEEYYSVADFPIEEDEKTYGSQERFKNLMLLLSNLENAIKESQTTHNIQLSENKSSKIFELLHALTNRIAELESEANFCNLEEGLGLTTELDSSVRSCDDSLKNSLPNSSEFQTDSPKGKNSVEVTLKKVRKKIIEIAAKESSAIETRIEKDFDRIERLERENDEALKFVEAFMEKTTRRTAELNSLKAELKSLSATLENFYMNLIQKRDDVLQTYSNLSLKTQESPLKQTVSGLLRALDNLKTRAREKNKACQKILQNGNFDDSLEKIYKLARSSRSSFTAKNREGLSCNITEIKQTGDRSLYLAWTKPEGTMADHVIGYEIAVNGTLNQKVRNPKRMQAVLYSIDVTKKTNIHLYGLFLNKPKTLLAVVRPCET